MPQQELKIKIGADVNEAVAGIKQVNKEVATLAPAMSKAGNAVAKTGKDFTGLSRVIQDLPFGFLGIQNNITQLLPAAGGLGLAVSALTAGITFASIGLQNWSGLFPTANDRIKDQIKAIKENREALDDYVATLEDVTQARIKGNQDAQKELVELKTLYDATQNQNIAIGKRRELVDELQKQYPKYFANIKDEIILTGGAKNAYDRLAAAITATARARAGEKILTDIQEQIIANEQQSLDNNRELSKLHQKIVDLQAKGGKAVETSLTGEERLTATGAKLNKLQSQYNDLLSKGGDLFKENINLNERAKRLSGDITATVEANPDSLLNPTGGLEKAKKKAEDKLKARPFLLPVDPVVRDIPKVNQLLNKQFEGHPALLPVEPDFRKDAFLLDVVDSISEVRKAGAKLSSEMGDAFSELFQTRVQGAIAKGMSVEQLEKFQEGLRATLVIGAQVADVLGNAFGAFGQALVQGQNALQAFFNSVKNALSQLIGQLLKTIATAAILSAITGGAGAAGGFSFLSALKGLLSVKPFAKGGLAFGPTLGLVGEGRNINRSNPEVISPLSDLKKFLGGGQQSQVYIPDLEVGYDKLRIAFNRANRQGRAFG